MELAQAFAKAESLIKDSSNLVRVVLSGRRRNMQVASGRIDMRPVRIKDEILLQVASNDGRQITTKNYSSGDLKVLELLESGYANILIEHKSGALSIRITKKGVALIHEDKSPRLQNLEHDRAKERLLDPSDPYLIEVGISDAEGVIKQARADKYRQVEEFLRLLVPTLNAAISAGHIVKPTSENPLTIVDLGCGNAYLTFATHQYLTSLEVPVAVIGIDIRPESLKRNTEIAVKLGISKSITFRAEAIDQNSVGRADVVIALHACDTATDDAIAWGVNNDTKLMLIAPCCQHDLQSQMNNSPEPWGLLTKHGLMKERLGDLLTDGLRSQILKLVGYRSEIIEFIGGEHTPRNILIRAVKTGAKPDASDVKQYEDLISAWSINPALADRINLI